MHHAIPLGATVPDNAKRLIWADEFVELSTLLPETMDKAVDPGPTNRGPTSLLALKIRTPVANTGKLRSIGQMPVIYIAMAL
jgi:hypothetical protein